MPVGSISLTSDCCHFQHHITSNFYATVSYKLTASFNKPNKARFPSLNPKQSEISPLNGEVVYNLRKIFLNAAKRASLFRNDDQTHIRVRD